MRIGLRAGLAAALIALASPCLAQKSADTLRVTWRDTLTNLDPYYNQLRVGLVVAFHIWDGLVYRDPATLQIKPLLATSWRFTDDTTIEFTLRQGVKFHDGSAFTADDVVYTINTIINDPAIAVPSNYQFLAGAVKIDDLHVRVKLRRVFPAAMEYIAMVLPIWPHGYRERVGAAEFGKHPVGTGPYRVEDSGAADAILLAKFDEYFDGSPKGRAAIGHIRIHEVPDAAAEIAAIVNNDADWIWDFPADKIPLIEQTPGMQVTQEETMRIAYINMDAAGRSGTDEPLKNLKLRQAILYAIDRKAMARNFMPGGSRVLDALCFPTQFGCNQAAAFHYDYDPDQARKLLAEAGFPEAPEVEIVTYLQPAWGVAIQTYLQAVGIKARISQLSTDQVVKGSLEGRNPLDMESWGSYSINDVSAILPHFFSGDERDYLRSPEVTALIADADTTDADKRRADYAKAIRLISEAAAVVPLFTYVKTYGFSRQLQFKPWQDEIPRFYMSSWK